MEIKILKRNDKKGNIQAIFVVLASLFGLALFLTILAYTIPKVTDEMAKTELNNTAEIRQVLNESDRTIDKLDPVFLIIFTGLAIGILISSFMIKSHPIFIPVYIFLIAFAIIVAVIMNNVYVEFATNSALNSTITNKMTYSDTIMNHLPIVFAGIGILSMIIIFARAGGEQRI